jgi:hypothetical protein
MLGQYFANAYFPQMTEEEAMPVAVDDLLANRRSSDRRKAAAKESALV